MCMGGCVRLRVLVWVEVAGHARSIDGLCVVNILRHIHLSSSYDDHKQLQFVMGTQLERTSFVVALHFQLSLSLPLGLLQGSRQGEVTRAATDCQSKVF